MRLLRILPWLGVLALAGCPTGPSPDPAGTIAPGARAAGRLVLLDPAPWSARMLAALGERVETVGERLGLRRGTRTPEHLARTLEALRRRMGVICENIRNAEVTRRSETERGPYRRRIVTVNGKGNVRVEPDPSELRRVHRPGHADADKDGYVLMPNVYRAVEESDLADARREYALLAEALERLAPGYVAPDPESFLPKLLPESEPAAPGSAAAPTPAPASTPAPGPRPATP